MQICICNVSVVVINGNIICVGAPTLSSYDVPRFDARARVFESCKGYVTACFWACKFARVRFVVEVTDITHRKIGIVLLIYPLYR